MFGEEDQAQQSQGGTDQQVADNSGVASTPQDDAPVAAPVDDSSSNDTADPQTPTSDNVGWTSPTDDSGKSDDSDDKTDNADTPAPDASKDSAALLDIKQQALQQLTPLMGHLDQTPEEKFRTTMMMIQASDNQDLVKDAYGAAMAIPDEKAKALALLDIVNEINYFTQQPEA